MTIIIPWLPPGSQYDQPNIKDRIHQELLDYSKWIEPTPAELHIRLLVMYTYINAIETCEDYYTVIPQGSSTTNSFLPCSDIDLIVICQGQELEEKEIRLAFGKIQKALWKMKLISASTILAHARVPILKVIDKAFGIHIDIGIGNINGALNIDRVLNYFKVFPLLKPLLMFMKLLVHTHKLDNPSNGGFGSNHLIQLCLFIIEANIGNNHLGDLLESFFDIYGNKLNIYLTGISTINGGSIFSKTDKGLLKSAVPQALICQDPQFHDNFLGTNSSLCIDFIHLCQRCLNHITTPLNTNSQTGILRCFGSIVEIIEVRRYFEEMYNKLTTMNPESFFHFGKKQFRKKIHSDAKYFQNQLLIKSNVNEEQKSNSNSSVQQPQKLSKKQLKKQQEDNVKEIEQRKKKRKKWKN